METLNYVLELENGGVFYLNVFSIKEAAISALLRSIKEDDKIRHLTDQNTGRKISNIELEYDYI